jgi:hypothetical protein
VHVVQHGEDGEGAVGFQEDLARGGGLGGPSGVSIAFWGGFGEWEEERRDLRSRD